MGFSSGTSQEDGPDRIDVILGKIKLQSANQISANAGMQRRPATVISNEVRNLLLAAAILLKKTNAAEALSDRDRRSKAASRRE